MLNTAQIPQHSHEMPQAFLSVSGGVAANVDVTGNGYTVVDGLSTKDRGGNAAHNNLQPSIVLNRATKF